MKTTAEMLEKFHQADQFGIRLDGSAVLDMQHHMARKRNVLSTQIKGIEGLLARHKIKLVRGTARIDGPGKVSATGEDGQERVWAWDRLIIATGFQLFSVPAFPFDGRRILSSNHILEIEQVPKSILIVAGRPTPKISVFRPLAWRQMSRGGSRWTIDFRQAFRASTPSATYWARSG